MDNYKISKCIICGLVKALKNEICAECERLSKTQDSMFSDLFGNVFKGFGKK